MFCLEAWGCRPLRPSSSLSNPLFSHGHQFRASGLSLSSDGPQAVAERREGALGPGVPLSALSPKPVHELALPIKRGILEWQDPRSCRGEQWPFIQPAVPKHCHRADPRAVPRVARSAPKGSVPGSRGCCNLHREPGDLGQWILIASQL